MIYPPNFESKIGFDKIRERINGYLISSLGKREANSWAISSDFNEVKNWLDETREFLKLIEEESQYPQSNYQDATILLEKAIPLGSFLSSEEFLLLSKSLATITQWLKFLKGRREELPVLSALTEGVEVDPKILISIDRVISEKGAVKDQASPALKKIRAEINQKKEAARKLIEKILRESVKEGFSSNDASLTLRGGRLVIPVLAQHKRRIKGFIHDESASGQTAYLEPAEVLEFNNDITDLEYREKREIVKILTELTDLIRPQIESLQVAYLFLGKLDFIQAKAKFSRQIKAKFPHLVETPVVSWNNARHVLLVLSFKDQNRKVVPLNISLDPAQRILVISGPNAGGKSVCLKTVALLQYMVQSGLPVPMDEDSKIGIFQKILMDIGDEQSIENDLSTYSSHLKNMGVFLQSVDANSLFLIDEFGTGTDPQFGGAIAEAILQELSEKQGFGVVTTHYNNLKKLAGKSPGMVNGAMRFDQDKMEPLYQLEIGKPGSSFALEISRKIGLPKRILDSAKQKTGESQVKLDQLLQDTEKEKQDFEKETQRLKIQTQELDRSIKEYQAQFEELTRDKKKILNEAKQEARNLLDNVNRKIEATIRGIKEAKAEKGQTKELRKELEEVKAKLKIDKDRSETASPSLKIGDQVKIKGQETYGEVIALQAKDAEVMIGSLKSKVRISRLEKVAGGKAKAVVSGKFKKVTGIDWNQKIADFNPDIDLRGMRVDQAISEVEKLVDRALLLGVNRLRLIHGKGYGILRKAIWEHLKRVPQVKNVQEEEVEQGGAGVTVVELN